MRTGSSSTPSPIRASRRLDPGVPIGVAVVATLAILVTAPLGAQRSPDAAARPVEADPADVESVDAIISALYDVISGPPGERDWDRFRSLFLPGAATLIPTAPPPESAPGEGDRTLAVLSPGDYAEMVDPYFRETGFFEREVARDEERFGNFAQAFSTYESRRSADDVEPFARGINGIQLVRHDGRWWLVSIVWDEERPGNPIPDARDGAGR